MVIHIWSATIASLTDITLRGPCNMVIHIWSATIASLTDIQCSTGAFRDLGAGAGAGAGLGNF